MKLITEMVEEVSCLVEADESGNKSHYIDGIFMQAETTNKNKRMYPLKVLANEVKRYNQEYVGKNRAMGELNHPQGPTVNLDRVSHIIKDLRVEGNDIYGKAKLLDTPMGNIAKKLYTKSNRIFFTFITKVWSENYR